MKQIKICKAHPIKSKNELQIYKKRELNKIQGTPKIILGKQKNDIQQIWLDDYRNCSIQQLRQLHSNQVAFQCASLICKATQRLAISYGNFILNENMVFKTIYEDQIFIWINPDLLANQSKIYLPDTHEAELSMIKSLINYFKLWLQTDFTLLAQVKTLEQLEFKIYSLKGKNHSGSNAANSTKVQSEYFGDNKQSNSSKNIDDKFSYKSKNIGKFSPSIKGSQPSQATKSMNNKLQFKHIFNSGKNPLLSSKNSQSPCQTGQFPSQVITIPNSISRTTGTPTSKYFPFKTTSANSKKILSIIRKADQNPDQYVRNNIMIDPQRIKDQDQKTKLKKSLNQVGEELDNLFLSNMEEQQDDHQEQQRSKQFQQLLG